MNYYLSVKASLTIDNEVERIIGLAVDGTDRKRAEKLELENKLHEKTKIIAELVAHDIGSPLVALSVLTESCKTLSERKHILLSNISESIRNIANELLDISQSGKIQILQQIKQSVRQQCNMSHRI